LHFEEKYIVLADKTALEANIVIMATGYNNMRMTVRKIFSAAIADRYKDVWNLDEEGEVNAVSHLYVYSYLYLSEGG
jgi:hypothetical protein